jgi:1D-myo-inositol-tetrakisphosphate 5-kinase/inositol-polyphosphate multikinase
MKTLFENPRLNYYKFSVFRGFLNMDSKYVTVSRQLINCVIDRLEKLKRWFERQRSYLFFSASLFLSYDAAVFERENQSANNELSSSSSLGDHEMWNSDSLVLKLIDFAHVFPADGKEDSNFLFGLSNLLIILRRVWDDEPQQRDKEQ